MSKKKNLKVSLACMFLLLSTFCSFGQDNKLIAACCEGETGKCVGKSNCTACSNCSRCGYCNSGGTCGVCAGRKSRTKTRTSTPKSYSRPTSTSTSSSTRPIKSYGASNTTGSVSSLIYHLPDDLDSEYYGKTLLVNASALNLRRGPGTQYEILAKLTKDQELIFLAMTGNWVKVRVKSNNEIGFVYFKYVGVLID